MHTLAGFFIRGASMTAFDKRARNVDEQLSTLHQRGLAIPDNAAPGII